ncbi:MAG: hypothetical protein ABF661_01615 [Oenococcus sp.]|uniref:hypothetical protein n=1 Tax=Oenococcus sp. TaxID=1979414 RepID=UPI0039EB3BCE
MSDKNYHVLIPNIQIDKHCDTTMLLEEDLQWQLLVQSSENQDFTSIEEQIVQLQEQKKIFF